MFGKYLLLIYYFSFLIYQANPFADKYLSASKAAMQPLPAAVTA